MPINESINKVAFETDVKLYFDRSLRYFPDNLPSIGESDSKRVTNMIATQKISYGHTEFNAMDKDCLLKNSEIMGVRLFYRHGDAGRWTDGSLANTVFIDSVDSDGKLRDIEIKLVLDIENPNGFKQTTTLYDEFKIPDKWQMLYDMNNAACNNLENNMEITLEEFAMNTPVFNLEGLLTFNIPSNQQESFIDELERYDFDSLEYLLGRRELEREYGLNTQHYCDLWSECTEKMGHYYEGFGSVNPFSPDDIQDGLNDYLAQVDIYPATGDAGKICDFIMNNHLIKTYGTVLNNDIYIIDVVPDDTLCEYIEM